MHELTWGLDVSTDKAKKAAVALDWSISGVARVVDVRHPLPAARARDLELTILPPDDELAAGRREGWIHVSCEPSDLLVISG